MTSPFHKHRFIPMYGMPNIVTYAPLGAMQPEKEEALNKRDADVRVIFGNDPNGLVLMKEVLLKLASGYTRYKFVFFRTSDAAEIFGMPAGCTVYHKEEKLGNFWRGHRDCRPCFTIHSLSIEKQLMRGSTIKTTDERRVVKEFAKHFKPLPLDQKFLQAVSLGSHIVYREANDKRVALNSVKTPLLQALQPYILANATALLTEATAAGLCAPSAIDISELAGLSADLKGAENIQTQHRAGNGLLVWVDGEDYVVRRPSSSEPPRVLKSEELPSRVKQQMGMLKLIDTTKSKVASGVGVRISEKAFYVLCGMED